MIKREILVNKNRKIIDLLQDYGVSYSDALKILRKKDAKVDGKAIKENVLVEEGATVVFYCEEEVLKKKVDIVFENEDCAVVYKLSGIETDGERGLESLLGMIAVHRLDRNTEGLMVFAKNIEAEKKLIEAFKHHRIKKYYVAEVVGEFLGIDKVYDAYLRKDSESSFVKISEKKQVGFVPIKTEIKKLKIGKESSVLQIGLLTGKTHQIRAHLAYLGNPIIGDGKYGKNEINKKFKEKTQKLAAFKLIFENVGIDSLNGRVFVRYPKWMEGCSVDKK